MIEAVAEQPVVAVELPLDEQDIFSGDLQALSQGTTTYFSDASHPSDRDFIVSDNSNITIESSSAGSAIIVPEMISSRKRLCCEVTA